MLGILIKYFSLFGDFEFALTYGKYQIHRHARILELQFDGTQVQNMEVVTRDSRYQLQPFIDLALGLRLENYFDSFRIMLDAGWEFHSLLKFNQLFRGTFSNVNPNQQAFGASDYPSTNGNLSLSGFVLRGRVEF